jgi:hypothetical protein
MVTVYLTNDALRFLSICYRALLAVIGVSVGRVISKTFTNTDGGAPFFVFSFNAPLSHIFSSSVISGDWILFGFSLRCFRCCA